MAAILIALSIPVLVATLATESVAFSERFYLKQYETLKLKQATGFSPDEFMQFSRTLWDYFRNRIASPQALFTAPPNSPQPLYQEHELAHLADVQYLFQIGWTGRRLALLSLAGSIGLLLILNKGRSGPTIAAAAAAGSSIGIACFLLLMLAIWFDFNRAFTAFHLISFDNMLWQLDPATDNLIRLFPEQFFQTAAVTIAVRALGAYFAVLVSSLWFYKNRQPRSS